MKVAFRTDASLEIGTGHVMRCLTLADALIVCAGGVLPTALLQQMGIAFETKHGEA